MPNLDDSERLKVQKFLEGRGATPTLVSRWFDALEASETDPQWRSWARGQLNECYRHAEPIDDVPDIAAWEVYCTSIVTNRLRLAGVPPDFLTMTFDQVKPRPEAKGFGKALTACRNFADNITDRLEAGDGLTICGDPGCGKSMLAALLCRATTESRRSCLFIRTWALLDHLRDFDTATETRERIEGVDLLALDDMGAEYGSDWSRAEIDSIVSARHEQHRSLIVTSNFGAGQLAKMYSPRVIDRLRERGPALDIRGASWRSK